MDFFTLMPDADPYSVLGLTSDADIEVVKAVYRTLSKKHHPDQGGSEEEFKRVNAAYNAIVNDSQFVDPAETESNTNTRSQEGLFGGIFSSEPIETKSMAGIPDYGITVEGDYLTASVIGLQHDAEIRDIVFTHMLDENPNPLRTVILYDLENTSDQVIMWHADYSKYIGSDSYTYDRSDYLVDDSRVGSRWKTFSVEIEGGTRCRFIEIVEKMPEGVTLSKIVHTLSIHAPGRVSGSVEEQERFEFIIEETDLPALEQPPI